MDGCLSDPDKIKTQLPVNRGHASAQQSKRAAVDSVEDNMHLATYVDEVLEQCEVCRALNKAPHVPIAGTLFNEDSYPTCAYSITVL